ncbi:hypothetical protein BJY00DRAFT_84645 [Aspergillus carlsbadensis]|nr:hypothetical protein BJY00DRAFT_84645 [Aspergillus carlsbadensis]
MTASMRIGLTELDFSNPSLNSVFPFLEALRPEADPTWHIRQGRLLDCYDAVWASYRRRTKCPSSLKFYGEADLNNDESGRHYFLLCLVPQEWKMLSWKNPCSKDAGLRHNIRRICSPFISSQSAGCTVTREDFFGHENRDEQSATIH